MRRNIYFDYKIGRTKLKEAEHRMLALTCTNEEKIPVTLTPVTAGGKQVGVENVQVVVQSGDGSVEFPDPNNKLSFFVVSGSQLGDTVFVVSADADLGPGVQNVSDFITLTVEGARAQNLGLVAGTPVLK